MAYHHHRRQVRGRGSGCSHGVCRSTSPLGSERGAKDGRKEGRMDSGGWGRRFREIGNVEKMVGRERYRGQQAEDRGWRTEDGKAGDKTTRISEGELLSPCLTEPRPASRHDEDEERLLHLDIPNPSSSCSIHPSKLLGLPFAHGTLSAMLPPVCAQYNVWRLIHERVPEATRQSIPAPVDPSYPRRI